MSKMLIIYYSQSMGNTKRIAQIIQKETGADIAEIETVNSYKGSYDDIVEQGHREVNSNFMPEIKPLSVSVSDYNTIILGTPVWWYTFAPAMKTFLSKTDLTGKTVYSFATNGGWIGHTFEDLKRSCNGSEFKSGMNIVFDEDTLRTDKSEIIKWIKSIK